MAFQSSAFQNSAFQTLDLAPSEVGDFSFVFGAFNKVDLSSSANSVQLNSTANSIDFIYRK